MKMLVRFVVDTKPQGILEFTHVIAARKTHFVAPGMRKTGVLRFHLGMNARIHDAVKSRNLKKGPCFIAVQDDFSCSGFYGIQCALCTQLKAKHRKQEDSKDGQFQNQILRCKFSDFLRYGPDPNNVE